MNTIASGKIICILTVEINERFCFCFLAVFSIRAQKSLEERETDCVHAAVYDCFHTLYKFWAECNNFLMLQRWKCVWFKFPTKNPAKARWCNLIKRQQGSDGFRANENSFICEKHFRKHELIVLLTRKKNTASTYILLYVCNLYLCFMYIQQYTIQEADFIRNYDSKILRGLKLKNILMYCNCNLWFSKGENVDES